MKNQTVLFFLLSLVVITSCTNPPPEKYFDIAVLNTNLLSGFAGNGFSRSLESPSGKLAEGSDTPVPMTRSEEINFRLNTIEENYNKVKNLKETSETKEMIQASKALYEYVLPVLKKEYVSLAKLYDNNSPKETIAVAARELEERYKANYTSLYEKLIVAGKQYAEKHHIKVNWNQ